MREPTFVWLELVEKDDDSLRLIIHHLDGGREHSIRQVLEIDQGFHGRLLSCKSHPENYDDVSVLVYRSATQMLVASLWGRNDESDPVFESAYAYLYEKRSGVWQFVLATREARALARYRVPAAWLPELFEWEKTR